MEQVFPATPFRVSIAISANNFTDWSLKRQRLRKKGLGGNGGLAGGAQWGIIALTMSILSPKIDVIPAMLAHRLEDLRYQLARGFANWLDGNINRNGFGETIYQAMKPNTDTLVAFAMEFTIRNTLKPHEAEAVIEEMFMLGIAMKDCGGYYIERFEGIERDRSRWAQAGQEYLLAGLAFQESCGSTGNKDADNLIRQVGADIFTRVFELTKKELKLARICL